MAKDDLIDKGKITKLQARSKEAPQARGGKRLQSVGGQTKRKHLTGYFVVGRGERLAHAEIHSWPCLGPAPHFSTRNVPLARPACSAGPPRPRAGGRLSRGTACE